MGRRRGLGVFPEIHLRPGHFGRKLCFSQLEGLDTIADIYINDQHVASTDNMFRRYRFEVKEHCRLGEK